MTQKTLLSSKTHLRKLMREILKTISPEEKKRQTNIVIDHLLNNNQRFSNAKHIALFLSMKHEELNTQRLIETVLSEHTNKHIYVPHVEMGRKSVGSEMVFFELESLDKYNNEKTEILKNMKKYEEEARIHEVKIFQYYNFVQKNGY